MFLGWAKVKKPPKVAMQTFAGQTWHAWPRHGCMGCMAASLEGLRARDTDTAHTHTANQLTGPSHWENLFRSLPGAALHHCVWAGPLGPGRPRPPVLLHRSLHRGTHSIDPASSHSLAFTPSSPELIHGPRSCLGNCRPPGTNWLSGASHKPRC